MAADCNCSNPSCPCYKGNQDKAGEQQASGPDASPQNESENYPDEYPDEQRVPWETVSPDATSHVNSGAGTTQSTNGHNTHGGAMTAPAGGNNGGGDIRSVQDMRNFWEQAGTTAASATDPLQNAAAQLDALASHLEAVQAHAAQHGDETGGQAAAAAEAYRQLSQKCRDAADAVEPAVAGCASAHLGLNIFKGAEEGLASLPNRHAETRAYDTV